MSKKRNLTEQEKYEIESIISSLTPSDISKNYKSMYFSIRDQYLRDKMLSDNQIEKLRKTKYFSDKYKRRLPSNTVEDVEAMLYKRFNRI